MPRNKKSQQPLFALLSAFAIVSSVLFLPSIWVFAIDTLLLPRVLASMVTGLLAGLVLGFVQQRLGQVFRRRLLAFWISSSAFGGMLGGLLAGAGHVFLQQLSAYPMPQPIPFAIIFAFIGLLQWVILQDETRRSSWQWPVLMVLLGISAAQGALLLPILMLVAAAAFMGRFLDRWQPFEDEPRFQSLKPYSQRLARLQRPEAGEAESIPAVVLAAQENQFRDYQHQG